VTYTFTLQLYRVVIARPHYLVYSGCMKSHQEYIGGTHVPALYADLLEIREHQHDRGLPPYIPPHISREYYGDKTVVSIAAEPYNNGHSPKYLSRIADIPVRASVMLANLEGPFTDEAYAETTQSGEPLAFPEDGRAGTIEIYSEPGVKRTEELTVDQYAGTGDLARFDLEGVSKDDLNVLARVVQAYRHDLVSNPRAERDWTHYGGRAPQLALQSLDLLFGEPRGARPQILRRKAGIKTVAYADVSGVVEDGAGYRIEDLAEYDHINPFKVTHIPLKHLRQQVPREVDLLGMQSDLLVAHTSAVTYEGRKVGFSGTTISYNQATASGGRDTMISVQRMPDGIVVARRYDLNQAVLDITNGPDELVVRPTPADMPSRYLPAREADALRDLGLASCYPRLVSLLAIGRMVKGVCAYPRELEAFWAESEQRRFTPAMSKNVSGCRSSQ
jgi:hypothetical protein